MSVDDNVDSICLYLCGYSERHVALGTFGDQLLNTYHKIMSIATLDVGFGNIINSISGMYSSIETTK